MKLSIFAFLLVLVLFPLSALAQTNLAGDSSIWDTIVPIVAALLSVVGGTSLVSAFVSSKGGPARTAIMAIVDLFAANWLKARNSDDAQ